MSKIKLGKDIYEVSGDLTKFFHAQHQIKQESLQVEKKKQELLKENRQQDYYELTAQALDVAIKQRKMIQDEAEIKTLLIWSGNGDVYHAMVKERLRLEKEQALAQSKDLFDRTIRQKRKQELQELQKDVAVVAGTILIFGIMFYMIVQWGIDKGLWASSQNDPRVVYQTQRIKK